ncbi:hypothetical protein SELMODRAFT_409571 [Selaginella moellendorffii]|uniref:Uncharacterized protein n=1 Tax=Selaginella moellendorffii TaxID=88036 RepID=D8RBV9_SELML|nr:hypothetical protein SELMODRAFT_409571 [Selaginella moellendorffii]
MPGEDHQWVAREISHGFKIVSRPFATTVETLRPPNTRKEPDVLFYKVNPNGRRAAAPAGICEVSDSQSLSGLLRRCTDFIRNSPTVNFSIGLKLWDHSPDRMLCVVCERDANGAPAPRYGYSFGPHAEYLQTVTDTTLQVAGFKPGNPERWSGVESMDEICVQPWMPRYTHGTHKTLEFLSRNQSTISIPACACLVLIDSLPIGATISPERHDLYRERHQIRYPLDLHYAVRNWTV